MHASKALEEAQEALRRSEELYRYIVELSSLVPWITDLEGNVLSGGPRWTEWTGAPVAAALGDGWRSFVHPDDIPMVESKWAEALASGRRLDIEFRLRWADGVYRWCHSRAARRQDGGGDGAAWYGTLDDVHEERTARDASETAQAELVQVSRLSAVGAMASVIAHDLRQPLTAAAHYLRGARNLLDRGSEQNRDAVREALDDADRSVVLAGEIVRRVREFVSPDTGDRTSHDLVTLIEEACRLAMADAPTHGIAYRLEIGASCKVLADRVQIQQVLVNLLRNAVEALHQAPRREIVIRTAEEGPACKVTVHDTGPGLTAEAVSRLFDPFFTTRQNGMGLGLSISRMLIEAHGGRIWLEDEGPGAAFSFTLPLDDPKGGDGRGG